MSDHCFLPALRFTMAFAALCLIASTWPLWTGSSSFPRIPFLRSLCGAGSWTDRACLALSLAGAVSTLVGTAVSLIDNGRNRTKRLPRIALRLETFGPWLFAVGIGFSVLLNQHRLQPWVWHFLLLSPLLTRRLCSDDVDPRERRSIGVLNLNGPDARNLDWITFLTGAIYFGSAISKCDASFIETNGQQLVEALLGSIGLSTRLWSDGTREVVAASLPLGELATAFLIVHPRFRRLGFPLSILMHALLIVAVGPLGLNHEPGVLIWNGFFIGQNAILWSCSTATRQTNRSEIQSANLEHGNSNETPTAAQVLDSGSVWKPSLWTGTGRLPVSLICLAGMLPAVRILGLCDPWPAWAVYASRPARVTILIERDLAEHLPEDLRRFMRARRLDDGRVFFRADLWSIDATGAPIYPGDRLPVAVALALSRRPELDGQVDIVVESAAGWWSGKRTSHEYRGRTEIEAVAEQFRLNTQPRVRP